MSGATISTQTAPAGAGKQVQVRSRRLVAVGRQKEAPTERGVGRPGRGEGKEWLHEPTTEHVFELSAEPQDSTSVRKAMREPLSPWLIPGAALAAAAVVFAVWLAT